jgi:hypothetical protein
MPTERSNSTFTVRELRAAIDELATDIPDVAALAGRLTEDTPDRSRRRVVERIAAGRWKAVAAPAVAALAVASVVVAAVTLSHSGGAGRHTAAPGSGIATAPVYGTAPTCDPAGGPRCFDTFSFNDLPGRKTSLWLPIAAPGMRKMTYTTEGERVTLFDPGVFDTSKLAGARKVQGFGITGYWVKVPGDRDFCQAAGGSPCLLPAVAWQYAPDAWGTVVPVPGGNFGNPRLSPLQIAAAVDPARKPLPVPVKVGHLPAGYAVREIETSPNYDGSNGGYGGGSNIVAAPSGASTECTLEQCSEAGLFIDVSTTGNPEFSYGGKGTSVDVNGLDGLALDVPDRGSSAELVFGGNHWHVMIFATAKSGLSNADLLEVAKGLTFAETTASQFDTSSWFAADEAVPY